jgi:GT2 family glycosyltransferase
MLLRTKATIIDEPTLLPIAHDVLMAAWDVEDEGTGSIDIALDGVPAERSRASLRLPLTGGGVRTVVAFRVPGRTSGELTIERRGASLARFIVGEGLASDFATVLVNLDDAARARLVGFVLGVCGGTFRLAAAEEFVAFCKTLIEAALPAAPLVFAPLASLTGVDGLYVAPPAPAIGPIESVFLVDRHRISENRFPPVIADDAEQARLILIAPRVAPGAVLTAILVGKRGVTLARLPALHQVPSVTGLAEKAGLSDVERRYVLACLGQLADNPDAVAAARSIQIFAPERARELSDRKRPVGAALELALSCGAPGVFVRGWIRDPHKLVSDAALVSPFGEHALAKCWWRLARPDLEKSGNISSLADPRPGFVALVPVDEPIPVLQHHLRLSIGGGALEIVPPLRVPSAVEARNMVLASVAGQDLTDELLAAAIAPAAAALHRRVMAEQAEPEIVDIGKPVKRPTVSFIIPLYRNLSFLRLQIGAFAVDPEVHRDVELVYVLDSPEQRSELEHLLRGLHALTGLPFRLVIMSANFGYAAANNTGVRAARANMLLLLNSDVIPIGPNWLAVLRAVCNEKHGRNAVGAVGPKLLFDDGSLQHAGLTFERDFKDRWYNTHFFKGYPRDWPAANVPREVPGVTGAAMLLSRAVYEAVGGLTEDYVIGDYEDSDLCLKIRAKGHAIRYEPRAELYHFERRSIELHAGYARTAASAYNRRLHCERWSAAMSELMVRFAGDDGSVAEPVTPKRERAGGRR